MFWGHCESVNIKISTFKNFVLTLIKYLLSLVSALRSPSMAEFLLGVESSDWLKHIKSILEAGIFISKVNDLFDTCTVHV